MSEPAGRAAGLLLHAPTPLLLLLARLTARLRPLAPYPGWSFNVAERDPAPSTRLRLAIWRACNRRRIRRPIRVEWHHGLRFHLFLGNDLSRQLFVAGCFEPNEFFLLDRLLSPGMVFVDVGANDGLYSLFAAAKVGRYGVVVAFEPSEREFNRLQTNVSFNRLDWAVPIHAGLSNEPGRGRLRIAGFGHEGHNTLGDFAYDSVVHSRFEDIELTTLDTFLSRREPARVDVVKVDVEGAEMSVLTGARRTLTEHRPLVFLELLDPALRHQGSTAPDVVGFLLDLGYEIHRFDEGTGLIVQARADDEYSENVVAVHRDRPWKGIGG